MLWRHCHRMLATGAAPPAGAGGKVSTIIDIRFECYALLFIPNRACPVGMPGCALLPNQRADAPHPLRLLRPHERPHKLRATKKAPGVEIDRASDATYQERTATYRTGSDQAAGRPAVSQPAGCRPGHVRIGSGSWAAEGTLWRWS